MVTLHADSWAELAAEWRRLWLSRSKAAPHLRVRLALGQGPVMVIWQGQARVLVHLDSGLPVAAP